MKRDIEFNRAALATEEEVNGPARARIQDYLLRTGLSAPDFARRIGYSDSAVRFFLNDRYYLISATARQLVAKAVRFIERYPVEPSARANGDLYETANVRIIQGTFEKLLPNPVAYMIYAPPGSQKSFVLEHQVASLNAAELAKDEGRRAFYVYARANIRPRDILRRVTVACGCRCSNEIDPMLNHLRFEFRNSRVIVVIDEAQHLSIECFETLRELLDRPPYFSLLFAGSHDLKVKFDKFSATLEQWNSRIIAKVRLPGLERAEARGIIEREIGNHLKTLSSQNAGSIVKGLIDSATVQDAFEGDRTYINVRTLTNALNQIKVGASAQDSARDAKEVA